jgi:hypothetical protein
MIFLYSRKLQFVLLLCWLAGMTAMYVQITGERPLWLAKASERIVERGQKARLGHMPEMSAPVPQPAPVPAADPKLNRCLELRLDQITGEHADTLTLEVDYVAALTKGFSIDKAHGYYLKDAPTFVIEMGEPWVSDIGNASFPGTLPQVANLELIVSKSRHLRLLVHTRSMRIASGAKLRVSPTEAGIRAEIHLPR